MAAKIDRGAENERPMVISASEPRIAGPIPPPVPNGNPAGGRVKNAQLKIGAPLIVIKVIM